MTTDTVRELAAVIGSRGELERAIDALQAAGIDRGRLSVLADIKTVERELGHEVSTAEIRSRTDLERSPPRDRAEIGNAMGAVAGVPAYLGAVTAAGLVAASGGTLAGVAVAALAGGGTGGVLGGLLGKVVGEQALDPLDEQLARGGILLWVGVEDAAMEARAREVLAPYAQGRIETREFPAPAPG
jgi:hypothetical protein